MLTFRKGTARTPTAAQAMAAQPQRDAPKPASTIPAQIARSRAAFNPGDGADEAAPTTPSFGISKLRD